MDLPVIILLVVVFDIIIFGTIIYVVILRSNKLSDEKGLPSLADSIGLPLYGGELRFPGIKWLSFMRSPYFLKGERDGYHVHIFDYSVRAGKSTIQYVTVRFAFPKDYPLAFSLSREHVFTKLGKKLGHHDLQTGNELFDGRFYVRSSDRDFAACVLLPEIQQELSVLEDEFGLPGVIRLDEEGLRYDEAGSFTLGATRARLRPVTELLLRLAQACDAYVSLRRG